MTAEQALREVVRKHKDIEVLFRKSVTEEILKEDPSLVSEAKLLEKAFDGETILKIRSVFENVFMYNDMKKEGYKMFDEEETTVSDLFFRAFYFPDFRPSELPTEIVITGYNYLDKFQGVFPDNSINGVGVCYRYDRLDKNRLIKVYKGMWLDGMLYGYCEIEDSYHSFNPCLRYAMMTNGYPWGTETVVNEDGYITHTDYH